MLLILSGWNIEGDERKLCQQFPILATAGVVTVQLLARSSIVTKVSLIKKYQSKNIKISLHLTLGEKEYFPNISVIPFLAKIAA